VCRRASLDLTPDLQSPARARAWVAAICLEWALPAIGDDLALATSEIVTNAVLHARTPIAVEMSVANGVVEVQVRDLSPLLPTVLPVRNDLVSDIEHLLLSSDGPEDDDLRHTSWVVGSSGSIAAGRGLHLLEAVTDCWGVSLLPHLQGKVVWFSLTVPHRWQPPQVCTCAAAGELTASGRPVRSGAGPCPS
jgi:hypothetical protein